MMLRIVRIILGINSSICNSEISILGAIKVILRTVSRILIAKVVYSGCQSEE